MRRRFGRRRGRSAEAPDSAVDPANLQRILELGLVSASSLDPVGADDVPASMACLGRGEVEGRGVLVGFGPRAGDALLATVALAERLREQDSFEGDVRVVAPSFDADARRVLAWLTPGLPSLRALEAPALGVGEGGVEPSLAVKPAVVPIRTVLAHPASALDRSLVERAAEALRGLAAKHGGAVRGVSGALELVLMAQPVAALRVDGSGPSLEILSGQRATLRLGAADLPDALDRLEGQVRKHLNDRKLREGDEGWRARVLGPLVRAAELRDVSIWPLANQPIDALAVAGDGRVVLAAGRRELSLAALSEVLESVAAVEPFLPSLLADAEAPVRLEAPRLVLAFQGLDASARRALQLLSLDVVCWQAEVSRSRDLRLSAAPLDKTERVERPRVQERAPAPARRAPPDRDAPGPEVPEREAPRRESPRRAAPEKPPPQEAPTRRPASFEEVSLFDLDEDTARSDDGARRRGRRRRGRGRGRAQRGAGEGEGEGAPRAEPRSTDESREESPPAPDRRAPQRGRRSDDRASEEAARARRLALEDDTDDGLAPLAPDAPDFDLEPQAPAYEEDEETEAAEPSVEMPVAKPAAPEREPAPRVPRRRAAVVAHADRDSLAAAILLARDLRLIEGFWVYPQADLMTFFRSVATDLRDETPVYLVGFTPSPARDVIQAVSLYRDRLTWFDHHDWAPEDLEAVRAAIGADALHRMPGARSSLPAVAAVCSRRSRFSDKFVDLVTSRFSEHDYERWGRLWWVRLGEIAERPGERRAEIEPLLGGRPSELAREGARAETPPPPEEAGFAARQDFRLVHFGGHTLVVVPVPEGQDLHLTARIVRERYAASLSLAHPNDDTQGLLVLGADDGPGRRNFHMDALIEHLAGKFSWVEALPNGDHVARMQARGLVEHPDRFDELLAEIAMARSVLEG